MGFNPKDNTRRRNAATAAATKVTVCNSAACKRRAEERSGEGRVGSKGMFVPFPEFNPGNSTGGGIVATATTATAAAAKKRRRDVHAAEENEGASGAGGSGEGRA